MNLELRNVLAAWCLDALRTSKAEARIGALEAFARAAGADGAAAPLAGEHASLLLESPMFERTATGGVRLRADVVRDLDLVRERAARFGVALADARAIAAAERDGLVWTLGAAAALFNARLFFEVHELLEESWRPAEGALRTFLQGLIQIAVGFHHLENRNLRGAASLLGEGAAKLGSFGEEAYGVRVGELCAATERVRAKLETGDPANVASPRMVVRQSRSEISR